MEVFMETAKIFKNGQSQAVRLPKGCRFEGSEVYVKKMGDIVLLVPKDKPWELFVNSLDRFTDDFMEKRIQPPLESRESL